MLSFTYGTGKVYADSYFSRTSNGVTDKISLISSGHKGKQIYSIIMIGIEIVHSLWHVEVECMMICSYPELIQRE